MIPIENTRESRWKAGAPATADYWFVACKQEQEKAFEIKQACCYDRSQESSNWVQDVIARRTRYGIPFTKEEENQRRDEMPSASEFAGGGDYLEARNHKDDYVALIDGVREETFPSYNEGQKDVRKLVLHFANVNHELVLNPTNTRKMIAAVDDDYNKWIGVQIVISTSMKSNQKMGFDVRKYENLKPVVQATDGVPNDPTTGEIPF